MIKPSINCNTLKKMEPDSKAHATI